MGTVGPASRRRGSLSRLLFVAGLAGLLAVSFVPNIAPSPGPSSRAAWTELTPSGMAPPTIATHGILFSSTSTASSVTFRSSAGAAIIVFVSLYGNNTVSLSDTAHDAFTTVSTVSQNASRGPNSLWILAAFNVAASSGEALTATVSGTSPDSLAAEFVEVTGVGSAPLDHVGAAENFSSTGSPAVAIAPVPASADDLVLAGISAHQTHNWNSTGNDTLLDTAHEPVGTAPMTGADLSAEAAVSGTVWINATTPKGTTEWLAEGLSLRPLGSGGLPVTFTFAETGLSTGQPWYVTVGSQINGSNTSEIPLSIPNGTYPFTVSPISGYLESPASGEITVGSGNATETVTFLPATDDWPTYMGEVTRNGANHQETTLSAADAPNLTELWTRVTGFAQSEPVVEHGTVYLGATDGYEYAFNSTTGRLLWKTFIGQVLQPNCENMLQGITSSATISGGTVYVGGANDSGNYENGSVGWYALSAATGAIQWEIPIGLASNGYYNWASPLIVSGYAYVGVASRCDEPLVWGGLLKVDLSTHEVVNFFNTTAGSHNEVGSSIWGSPMYVRATNTVYVTTGNPHYDKPSTYSESVIALNATTLAVQGKWQVPADQAIADSDFGTTPDYFRGPSGQALLTAMNKNGYVYTFNATNVTAGPTWENMVASTAGLENVAPLASGDGLLYDGSGQSNVSGVTYPGAIRALYPGNGTVKWVHGMPGDVFGAPAYANGIVVATGGPLLEVFNAATGAPLWNWTCKTSFNSGPSIAEGRIYATCANTFAFGLSGLIPSSSTLRESSPSLGSVPGNPLPSSHPVADSRAAGAAPSWSAAVPRPREGLRDPGPALRRRDQDHGHRR